MKAYFLWRQIIQEKRVPFSQIIKLFQPLPSFSDVPEIFSLFFIIYYSHKSIKPTCFSNITSFVILYYYFNRLCVRMKMCRPLSWCCWRMKILIKYECFVWISDEKCSIIMSLLTVSSQWKFFIIYSFVKLIFVD